MDATKDSGASSKEYHASNLEYFVTHSGRLGVLASLKICEDRTLTDRYVRLQLQWRDPTSSKRKTG